MRTLALLLSVFALFASHAEAQSEFWCWDGDEILAFVQADTVRIQHLAALYNCCPEPITYEVVVGDATILVVEKTMSLCYCTCCANLEMILTEVPSGPWNILFRWFDMETGDWMEVVLEIVVPDVGQGYEPIAKARLYSGCLQATGVPGSTDIGKTWGSVKNLFR